MLSLHATEKVRRNIAEMQGGDAKRVTTSGKRIGGQQDMAAKSLRDRLRSLINGRSNHRI
jgi:hypothetical protein